MRQSLKAGVKAVSVPELFVTPPDLAERVADEAYIYPGMTVLEPNGGLGALAEAARKRDGDVTCVEIAHAAVQVLRGKGFTVHHDDFLTVDLGGQTFDRVVANPPFSAEIPHVQRAWSMLKPGGRLVAIMSAGVSFRQDKATKAFRDFVEEHGEMEDLPEDSFASSGTNVRTVLVTLDKPQ
jgi:16S rRNA A1518/A1519 N6-dimethyltransferase RsmA/KsgA/DIM1 with predicted DNA glycosylase/AP lyase activity